MASESLDYATNINESYRPVSNMTIRQRSNQILKNRDINKVGWLTNQKKINRKFSNQTDKNLTIQEPEMTDMLGPSS